LKQTTLKILALSALLSAGFLAAFFGSGLFSSSPAFAGPGGGGATGNCLGGGAAKIENPNDSTTITAPAGQVITQVAIKAGTECFIFNSDGTQGCYTVTGLGTASVTVTRAGSGPTCKEISHIEFTTSTGPTPPPPPPPPPTTTAPPPPPPTTTGP
jgi:hypothetical protein